MAQQKQFLLITFDPLTITSASAKHQESKQTAPGPPMELPSHCTQLAGVGRKQDL